MAQRGDPVILVRAETSPEDILGMAASQGILTSRGGMTSHAAVVARGMGKCCVVGCGEITIDPRYAHMMARGKTVAEGEFLSVDGTTGEVVAGNCRRVLGGDPGRRRGKAETRRFAALPAVRPDPRWADEVRRLGVRANADTPRDAASPARSARRDRTPPHGAHVLRGARITAVREMILAETPEGRKKALAKILPMQRGDFVGIFRETWERPVTDPPASTRRSTSSSRASPRRLAATARRWESRSTCLGGKVEALSEANPMLGHRGCRLGLTHPEIYEDPVRAIFEAVVEVARGGARPCPRS
jgi:pyruvate,orthophosphate dikinase